MKTRKFLLAVVLCLVLSASALFAAEVEDALTPCPEQSVYTVLKLNDTKTFLKWLFSKENIDIFMPLILASEESNEILGAVEMISAFAENTPLDSVALLAGVAGDKTPLPFFKMAFTVKPDAEIFVKKVADGSASAIDIAKLVLGKDNPIASFAETMIKVEKGEGNILRVDNELFMTAQDNMVIAGLSADDVKTSLKALENDGERLLTKLNKRFSEKDFAWIHVDTKTLKTLDEDDEIDLEELMKYVRKPVDVEFAFKREPAKFLMSMAYNLKEALTPEYFEQAGLNRNLEAVKGGHIRIDSAGAKSPLLALGGLPNLTALKTTPEGLDIWKDIVRQAKNRFNISEDDLVKFLSGALSLVLNDNVSVEGIKIPAAYISMTGNDGIAGKIFTTLEKSPHFHKVQDGVLQIDSSVSPVSCLVTRKDDTMGINFANIENLSAKPVLAPALEELINTEAILALWLDFAAIQSWILDSENGVLVLLEPIARFSGQGEIFDSFKEILTTKLSVPSLAMHADSYEVVHMEFNIDNDVKVEDGLMSKLVKIGKKFLDFGKVETKQEENK